MRENENLCMNFKDNKQDFKEFSGVQSPLVCAQMPQITYSHIGDVFVKKFEIRWPHSFNCFLVVSLVVFSF